MLFDGAGARTLVCAQLSPEHAGTAAGKIVKLARMKPAMERVGYLRRNYCHKKSQK